MTYREFTIQGAIEAFWLNFEGRHSLFGDVPAVDPSPWLRDYLAESLPLAERLDTKKGWSEFVIAPILLDVWRHFDRRAAFFSGLLLDVDASRGLIGESDFFLSWTPTQFLAGPPCLVVTVSQNDNIKNCFGECIAQLVAARIANERTGMTGLPIFGVATTGREWQFLRLEGTMIHLDPHWHRPHDVAKILGVLRKMLLLNRQLGEKFVVGPS